MVSNWNARPKFEIIKVFPIRVIVGQPVKLARHVSAVIRDKINTRFTTQSSLQEAGILFPKLEIICHFFIVWQPV